MSQFVRLCATAMYADAADGSSSRSCYIFVFIFLSAETCVTYDRKTELDKKERVQF